MRSILITFVSAAVALTSAGCGTAADGGSASNEAARRQAAIDAALEATKIIGLAALAVRPCGDLQAIFEGGMPFPSCPAMETHIVESAIELNMDYASGCAPVAGRSLRGSLRGQFAPSTSIFDFALEDVAAGADGGVAGNVRGRIGGGAEPLFVLEATLTRAAGATVRGNATTTHDPLTASLQIADASLMVTDSQGAHSVRLSAVAIASASAVLLPESGAAVVRPVLPDGDDGSNQTFHLEFTPQTSLDRTVAVTARPAAP